MEREKVGFPFFLKKVGFPFFLKENRIFFTPFLSLWNFLLLQMVFAPHLLFACTQNCLDIKSIVYWTRNYL